MAASNTFETETFQPDHFATWLFGGGGGVSDQFYDVAITSQRVTDAAITEQQLTDVAITITG